MYRETFARIDLGAIKNNVFNARKFISKDTKLLAVVKADAYGHGSVQVAGAAVEAGAEYLAVAMAEEGVELREAGFNVPILILGVSNDTQMALAVDYNIEICVSSISDITRLIRIARGKNRHALIHLKVDTGMGRIGFSSDSDFIDALNMINGETCIILEGMFSHLACADEADASFSYVQKRRFDHYAGLVKDYGLHPILHLANSAAMLQKQDFFYDMTRFGISLYGYYPSEYVDRRNVFLQHAMSVCSCIVFLKTIDYGDAVSYGSTFIAQKKMRIATVPIGYGDGYNRLLSNRGKMIVVSGDNGYLCPVVGRVCMDQTMIDVSDVPSPLVGDSVIILGSYGMLSVDADDIAKICNTISYEILLDFNARIPRIYEK